MIALFVIMSFYMKQTYRGLLIPSIPTPSRDVILSLYGLSAAYLLSYVIDKKPHSKPGIVLHRWEKNGVNFHILSIYATILCSMSYTNTYILYNQTR